MSKSSRCNIVIIFILIILINNGLSGQSRSYQRNPGIPDKKQELDSIVTFQLDGFRRKPVRQGKMDFIFNNSGLMICSNRYDWNEEILQWVLRDKTTCLYDAKGRITEKNIFLWEYNSTSLYKGNRSEYKYDDQGSITSILYYNRDPENGRWILNKKQNGPLHAPVPEVVKSDSCPDPISGEIFQCQRENSTFNKYGDIRRVKIYTRQSTAEKWQVVEHTRYAYDSKHNLKRKISRSGTWLVSAFKTKEAFEMNKDISHEDLIVPEIYCDLIYGYYLNCTIPVNNCNSRIDEFRRVVSFPFYKYREKGVLYYSSFH